MTACANCETTVGPFSRREGLGPICRPSTKDELAQLPNGNKGKPDPRVKACNDRRRALDEKRYGKEDRSWPQ